jgi:hypothetical protein
MNSFRFKTDSVLGDSNTKDLVQDKLNSLFSIPSPYVERNGILFIRDSEKIISKKFIIKVENTEGKVQYFPSILECSLSLNISRKIIKYCLITGNSYNNYIIKFDSYK